MPNILNTQVMLPVVMVLLLIKFGLLPVLSWQNKMLVDIEQYEKRNNKAQNLLDSKAELIEQLDLLRQSYQTQKQGYPRFAATEDFHIETKVMFDKLLNEFNLKVKRFFWRDSTNEEVFSGMYKARFNVDFTGRFKDFALLQARLGTSEKAFRIINFGTTVSKQSATSIGLVDGTLTIEAYYWLGGTQ